jgi:hypothetical protein
MRPLIELPAAGVLVLVGALLGAPDSGSAALIRTTTRLVQAQAPAGEPVIVKRSINLTEEDRHTIREIVLKDSKVSPDSNKAKIEIGDAAPKEITTYEFPDLATEKIPALKSQRYFIHDGAIVIVSSNDGKVADIVKPE